MIKMQKYIENTTLSKINSALSFLLCILECNCCFKWHISYFLLKFFDFLLKFPSESWCMPYAFSSLLELNLRLRSNTIYFDIIVYNNAASAPVLNSRSQAGISAQCSAVNTNPNNVFKLFQSTFNTASLLFHESIWKFSGFLMVWRIQIVQSFITDDLM